MGKIVSLPMVTILEDRFDWSFSDQAHITCTYQTWIITPDSESASATAPKPAVDCTTPLIGSKRLSTSVHDKIRIKFRVLAPGFKCFIIILHCSALHFCHTHAAI